MTIKICSANIRYENEDDGIHNWGNRLPLIADFINESKLVILGTQEGRQKQIESLAAQIHLTMIHSHREWIDVRMYPTLFLDLTLVKLLDSGDFWLSETPNICGSSSFKSMFPRLATWVKIQILSTKKILYIVNTHLDHVKVETRIEQAKVLVTQSNLINKENYDMILMGDFNDSPKSECYKNIITEFKLLDPWVEKNHPETSSHHGFLGEKVEGNRIDYILCSKTIECISIELDKRSREFVYLSDHFPLVATLAPKVK